ncbi:amidohydrolase family protein [Shinella curvata]|uniref:Amidohydrolase family protein n=1 Tax=Shinella curvata TaxID=1817964 RepID=A0ABT8XJG7_9HYPH|nr:amidohydrolase family protein [Shinella curvata]MCJ8056079.1 amidohydrolase family protein [Shinella curvata]MDO6123320.1 amidohydrolase family protein [Shinella curvata]
MVRDTATASLANLAAGRSFALTGGTVILDDGSQSASDILVGADGRILAVEPYLDPSACGACVDITGMLVTAGFLDAHQHLDKTGVLRFTPNPSGTLQGARDAFAKYARTAGPDDIHKRATRTVERCLSRGTTGIRSHINVDKDAGFHGIETLAGIRDAEKDRITLQLVAFMTPHPGQDFDWLGKNIDGAVALADAVGGTPAVSEDPPRYLDILFSAAVKAGKPIDLHLDEHLKADVHLLDAALERIERFGMQGRTVFSHVSVLSALPRQEFQRIAERLLALDVGVVTLPAANLYLQGRDAEMLPPRGLTRVAELYRAGVTIATASDNIQDPFVPTGSGDMLEIARWTLLAGHLRGDELAAAHRMITTAPARLMGLGKEHGLKAGARADFVVTDCIDTDTLVAGGPDRAFVFSKGRLVSQSTTENIHLRENA